MRHTRLRGTMTVSDGEHPDVALGNEARVRGGCSRKSLASLRGRPAGTATTVTPIWVSCSLSLLELAIVLAPPGRQGARLERWLKLVPVHSSLTLSVQAPHP